MPIYATDHAGLEIVSLTECLRLLDVVPVGRVGFYADGEVVMLPVNFVIDGQDVIFRTGAGSKLSSIDGKSAVGFEADEYDASTHSGWSVVVSGFAEEVDGEEEIRRLNDLGLQSWGRSADDPHWIRIRPTSITGRRTPGAAFAT